MEFCTAKQKQMLREMAIYQALKKNLLLYKNANAFRVFETGLFYSVLCSPNEIQNGG